MWMTKGITSLITLILLLSVITIIPVTAEDGVNLAQDNSNQIPTPTSEEMNTVLELVKKLLSLGMRLMQWLMEILKGMNWK